ncbi:MAG: hypothetical protein EON91_09975 [Brevundimonas sp.]|uniref:hypothetical protein n=1 Tax=Brevundimonas sp. TaxID=1871086 RepID=UPI00122376C5|nr:hypothetical protein [Brevundimonas sp.]RZJ17255.1 MAG: hypothetical protein EON91_09975 [Brevundimonas sp.]
MKIQAILSIDIEADDVRDVHYHKSRLERALNELKVQYPTTQLVLKTRRPRVAPRAAPPPKLGEGFELVRVKYVG